MTPQVPVSIIEEMFRNPLIYGLGFILLICYMVAEITGKIKGPLNSFIMRRRALAQKAAKAMGEPSAEMVSLRLQMAGLVADVERLQGTMERQQEQLNGYQEREEMRDNLASEHRIWDVDIMARLIDKGERDIPNPPPLHVHPSMFGAPK